MALVSIAEFWEGVAASGLVAPEILADLRRDFARRGGALEHGTEDVAKWLGDMRVLTRWQARQIARGGKGPYIVGDYRLLDRPPGSGGERRFTAIHEPSGRGVDVVLLDAALCKDITVWTEIVRRTGNAHRTTHPVLSRTWALEQHKHLRFLVCEHVEGAMLSDELQRLGPMPPDAAAGVALAVAAAVSQLHAAGGVHGGLSLDAILRQPPVEGGDERSGGVKLLQFPLVGDPHLASPAMSLVTAEEQQSLGRAAAFVAPELIGRRAVCDARTDVYAIGCILHALLTGRLPCWQGEPVATLVEAVETGPPPLGPPEVPRPLAAVVNQMVARDPAQRPVDATEVAKALGDCLGVGVAALRPAELRPEEAAVATGAMIDPRVAAAPVRERQSARPERSVRPVAMAGREPPRRGGSGLTGLVLGVGGLFVAVFALLVGRNIASDSGRKVAAHRADAGNTASGTATSKPAARPDAPAAQHPPAHAAGGAATPGQPSPSGGPGTAAVAAASGTDARGGDTAGPGRAPPDTAAAKPARLAFTQVVVDDATLPWASPSHGRPPAFDYLIPGSELILRVRLAALRGQPEGGLLLEALGPGVAAAVEAVAKLCGCRPEAIDTIQAGWQAGKTADEGVLGLAVTLVDAEPLAALVESEDARKRAWGATTGVKSGRETIHRGRGRSFWMPVAMERRLLVVGPDAALVGMVESREPVPTLPAPLEAVTGMLDEERHVAICGMPHYFLHDGRELLGGSLAPLVGPLAELCGDEVKAAAVSLHVGEQCFVELDAVSTLDLQARDLARQLADRVSRLPEAAEEYCAARQFDAYGRRLVLRLPTMLRALVGNLRQGGEHKVAVVNACLPLHAAHNVALAAELALAQAGGGGTTAAARPAAAAPRDALGKLRTKMTLSFAKDTLEKSIQMISEEIKVPMEIRGPDLQLEGITKNQSFALDEREKTAEQILKTILAKADPVGRLIFVVRKQGSEEAIEITTRAAAAKRRDVVPPGQDPPAGGKEKP